MQHTYYDLGAVYCEMMQYDTALNYFAKTALVRPLYAGAYCNMGVIYKNLGDLELAIACYERYLLLATDCSWINRCILSPDQFFFY